MPVTSLAPDEVLERSRGLVSQELLMQGGGGADFETQLRQKLDQYHLEVFHRTQTETTKRWTFEQEIKRLYFHVTELEESQLSNWNKYLDFEESQGDYQRTTFLYERCLSIAANYDEIWLRYARWMYAQPAKEEEVRSVYTRAGCIYAPIARPEIRLQWALFEEASGRPSVAAAIYEAILVTLPDNIEAIFALAHLQRRQYGPDAAMDVFRQYLNSVECSIQTKGALVAEMASFAWRKNMNASEGRLLFQSQQHSFAAIEQFWSGYITFEIEQPISKSEDEHLQFNRVKAVHEEIRQSPLPEEMSKNLSRQYLRYLTQCSNPLAAKEFMVLDNQVNGPASIAAKSKMTTGHVPVPGHGIGGYMSNGSSIAR